MSHVIAKLNVITQSCNLSFIGFLFCFIGFPVEQTPSHIIPIRIGDPLKSSKISDLLMFKFGHYIQAINYPTVARGEEKLRLAPTPFHNVDMMNQLVADMKEVWKMLDMPLKAQQKSPESQQLQDNGFVTKNGVNVLN